MVVSGISHGLGNQLFQYAMGLALATRRGAPFKLDLGWFQLARDVPGLEGYTRDYRLHAFNVSAEAATPAEVGHFARSARWRYDRRLRGLPWRLLVRHLPSLCAGLTVEEIDTNFQPSALDLPGDVYLRGYWQNERYFVEQTTVLRQEFTLRDPTISDRAADRIERLRRSGRPVVSVQVRRGDVARAHEVLKDLTNMPYALVSSEYLHAAMAEFGDATFLVFSDSAADLDWCRANLHAADIHFAEGGGDLDDFAAMTLCDHHVISNSSFGWWAAWLNGRPGRVVVAPRRWFREGHAPKHRIDSLIPRDWLLK